VPRALALSGVAVGILSGLLGVGGDFLMMPALCRYPDLAMQSVAATLLDVIAMVSAIGVASSAAAGTLN
jgi:uncharacterized membrane protein YfcA